MIVWLVLILVSCNNIDSKTIEKNMNSSNTEIYEYDLGFFGDEEGSWINKQAKHFEISEIKRNHNTGQHLYIYKPKEGFTGTDVVEIETNKGSNGASFGTKNLLKIVFNLSD